MVPLLEPEVKAIERLRLEFDIDCATVCPVIMKVLCDVISGKQVLSGLFTEVTVPLKLLPFWVKLTVNVVAAGIEPL